MPFMSDNANIDEDIKNKEWRYDEKRIRKSAGVLRESLARKDGGDSWHRALG